MSTPFGGVKPVLVPFSGNCDANGNLKLQIRPRAAFWSSLLMTAKASAGSPIWELTTGGLLVGVGRGQRPSAGDMLVPPGDTLQLQVIGALANAAVIGTLQGYQAPTMEDLAGVYRPQANTIALDTASLQTSLGTLTQVAGGPAVSLSKQPVPAGTHSIGFVVEANIFPASIIIQPDQTLANTGATKFPNVGPYWFPWDAKDTTVSFQMTPTATNGCTVDFFASPMVWPNNNPGSVLSNTPALWQAPNVPPVQFSVALNVGVALGLVAAAAGSTVYVFCLNSTEDSTSAVGILSLQDTGGTGYNAQTNNTAVNPGPALFFGSPFPAGLGAQIKNIGTGSLIARGSLVYSQG